jgi:hypothetical protein
MDSLTQYRINSPKVIHETIDGETVIVNLDSGNYYSLEKVGADIWALIGKGIPLRGIVDDMAHRYTGTQKEIEQAVHQFMNELEQEELVITDKSQGNGSDPGSGIRDRTEEIEGRTNFETPALHKYSDMQDLLLLDPIHEVDDTGWPSPRSDVPVSDE